MLAAIRCSLWLPFDYGGDGAYHLIPFLSLKQEGKERKPMKKLWIWMIVAVFVVVTGALLTGCENRESAPTAPAVETQTPAEQPAADTDKPAEHPTDDPAQAIPKDHPAHN